MGEGKVTWHRWEEMPKETVTAALDRTYWA